MAGQRVRGIGLRGDDPRRLQLSDGSRLLLDGQAPDQGAVKWRRLGRRRSNVSVVEASRLAGPEFSAYIETRTRAEVEWLRAMSDWYREQAARLQTDLSESHD